MAEVLETFYPDEYMNAVKKAHKNNIDLKVMRTSGGLSDCNIHEILSEENIIVSFEERGKKLAKWITIKQIVEANPHYFEENRQKRNWRSRMRRFLWK